MSDNRPASTDSATKDSGDLVRSIPSITMSGDEWDQFLLSDLQSSLINSVHNPDPTDDIDLDDYEKIGRWDELEPDSPLEARVAHLRRKHIKWLQKSKRPRFDTAPDTFAPVMGLSQVADKFLDMGLRLAKIKIWAISSNGLHLECWMTSFGGDNASNGESFLETSRPLILHLGFNTNKSRGIIMIRSNISFLGSNQKALNLHSLLEDNLYHFINVDESTFQTAEGLSKFADELYSSIMADSETTRVLSAVEHGLKTGQWTLEPKGS